MTKITLVPCLSLNASMRPYRICAEYRLRRADVCFWRPTFSCLYMEKRASSRLADDCAELVQASRVRVTCHREQRGTRTCRRSNFISRSSCILWLINEKSGNRSLAPFARRPFTRELPQHLSHDGVKFELSISGHVRRDVISSTDRT